MRTQKQPAIQVVRKAQPGYHFGQIYDGEPIVVPEYHMIRCCDCGKCHLLRIRKGKRGFVLTTWALKKQTDARRRTKKYRHVNGVKWP